MIDWIHAARGRFWRWFEARAHGPHALFWLGACALLDPIFFPIAPEIYLVALMLARKDQWRKYLVTTIFCSTIGATLGYFVGAFVFDLFGNPLIEFYKLQGAFAYAQQNLGTQVFLGMLLVPFTLIPEKVFVLAAGFLHANFLFFILGFFVGRSVRIMLIVYLTQRFGEHIIGVLNRYFLIFMLILLALLAIYATLRLHILPL